MTMADRSRTSNMATGQTVVGIFDGQNDAEKALNGLKDAGFTPDQVSVVAKDTRETKSMVENSSMGGAETTRHRDRRAARAASSAAPLAGWSASARWRSRASARSWPPARWPQRSAARPSAQWPAA